MATGLVDTRPEIEGFDVEVDGSIVRYCPICDGFEATDKEICVMGNAEHAGGKAIFLRTFSNSVTLLTPDSPSGSVDVHGELADAGVRIFEGPARLRQEGRKIVVSLQDAELHFDLLYPVLGCAVRFPPRDRVRRP